LLKIMKQHQCSEMITTGGIGLQNIPEQPKIYCTSNDEKLFKKYTRNKLIEKEIFGVVGPIVGVSGILLGLGKKRNVKGAALLAETFAHPMFLGIKGAKEMLRVLEAQFKFGINLKKMSKEIVEVEKELIKRTKEWASELRGVQRPAGAQPKNKDVSYIG